MHVVFRTDASIQIGNGHVMRCLTLADALSERGAKCTFVSRMHSGHLLDLIVQRGHAALPLAQNHGDWRPPPDPAHAAWLGTDWTNDAAQTRQATAGLAADWLVVDHYALDRLWHQTLRPCCKRIMVIDDLADRVHDCDLLLDQNLGRTERDYAGLVGIETQQLLGPQYALLRPEFAQQRLCSLQRRAQKNAVKKLLIAMGGVDKDNATGQVLNVLKSSDLPPDLEVTVVMGPHAPYLLQVQQQAAQMPLSTQVLVGVSHMAQLMVESDLAIGAAGGTAWERCVLGLPSIIVVLAENQKAGAQAMKAKNAAFVFEDIWQIGDALMLISNFSNQPSLIHQMSQAAAALTDGLGASHVAQEMSRSHV